MADSRIRMHSRPWRAAAGLFALLSPLFVSLTAIAQPLGKSVVVTFGVGNDPSALDLAAAVEEQFSRRQVPLLSLHEARDRFTGTSRAPQSPTPSDLESLAKEARKAVEHVAFGRSAAAEESVRGIVALAERSLESLNRETQNARQLLDACLALVRSSLHDGRRDRAIEQAMGCRRLVPDLAPKPSAQPANVIGVLAEADDELRRMRIGSLKVVTPHSKACSVYLNGRHLGMTPFTLDRAAVGTYRVQVECDDRLPGRVHVVHLGDQLVELQVDPEFDRSVVSEPRLGLSYEAVPSLRASLVSHAVQLGRETHAEEAVLVRRDASTFELVRINVGRKHVVAATRGPLNAADKTAGKSLSEALDALAQGRFLNVSPEYYAAPVVSSPNLKVSSASANEPLNPADRRSGTPTKPIYKKWWLWTTVGLVVAGGVTAGVLLGMRDRGNDGPTDPTINVPTAPR